MIANESWLAAKRFGDAMIAKKERGKIERHLSAALTHACEQAKPLLPGFCVLAPAVPIVMAGHNLRPSSASLCALLCARQEFGGD
ncbi:hypothetical protein HOP60_19920 [Halomonas daqingensis]|uniref:Uncharacterized protein n=1 Tax=Billgrantia desiderata TaxID=52021 RepID=A0ABS9BAT0_9GAMM|nr:hypothetical protein [Halomonas desiderata]MCE8044410.1 hypothetical protein [Halomonas desiderata]MCE8048984.1 hypothetical protein [Halomonas desiderata]